VILLSCYPGVFITHTTLYKVCCTCPFSPSLVLWGMTCDSLVKCLAWQRLYCPALPPRAFVRGIPDRLLHTIHRVPTSALLVPKAIFHTHVLQLRYVRFFSVRAATASVLLHGLKVGSKHLFKVIENKRAATASVQVDFKHLSRERE